MNHRASVAVTVVACCSALALTTSAMTQEQDASPRFYGGVELIQLVVSVLDDKRQPVRGLTEADFTILDNGRESPIRAFAPVELPASRVPAGVAAWTRDVAPDIATNQVREEPGRLVVILMDRSIPHHGPTVTARAIATSIVESLGPNDLAALISTGAGEPQNFTSDRARLIRSIEERDWSTGSGESSWTLSGALNDPRCLCGLCVFDTVTRVAEEIRDTPGRSKSLFFIGSGMVLQPERTLRVEIQSEPDPMDCGRRTREGRQKMLDAIDLSNLTVHSIDPKGLATVGPQTRATSRGGAPAPEGVAARLRREAQQAETNETLATQGTLRVLPDLTGGRTVVNRNMPEEMVPAIFRESESYYVIGFEAAAGARVGAPRSIEVKVARRGVRVSTRRRYVPPQIDGRGMPRPYVDGAGTATALPNDAVSGLLPDARLPLTMALAAFAGPDGPNAVVSVSVDASGFVYDAESSIPLDVSVTVADQTGRPVASARQTSTIPGPRAASSRGSAIHIPTHLALPPGDYEVRVAISDTARGTTASVYSHVMVPAFATERLSLSDIAIERVTGASTSTTPLLAVVPITERAFERTAPVQALLQIYQGTTRRDAVQPVSLRVRIIDTADNAVRDQSLVLEPARFSTNRTADARLTLPVQNLPPGEYLLRLDATMDERVVGRAVRFEVR